MCAIMKKLITITSLLIAGTALANAESLVLPNSGNATGTGTNSGPNLVGDISNIFSYGTYRDSDTGKLYVSSNQNGLGNYPQGDEGKWSNVDGVGTITLCGRGGAGGDHVAFVLGSEIAAGTQLISLTLNAGAISDESYVSSYRLVVGLLDASGTLLGSEVSTYDTDSDLASVTVNFATAVTWNTGYKIIAGVVGNGNSALSNTKTYSISGISASYTVSPSVPEPSAFGLLAGAGALALVAARRRRQKKA